MASISPGYDQALFWSRVHLAGSHLHSCILPSFCHGLSGKAQATACRRFLRGRGDDTLGQLHSAFRSERFRQARVQILSGRRSRVPGLLRFLPSAGRLRHLHAWQVVHCGQRTGQGAGAERPHRFDNRIPRRLNDVPPRVQHPDISLRILFRSRLYPDRFLRDHEAPAL